MREDEIVEQLEPINEECLVAPDLVKVTEIYLVPSSFIVAALAAADSNPHRAAVSLLGLIVSILWSFCSLEAHKEESSLDSRSPTRTHILAWWLPILFITGWFVSIVIHVSLWNKPI